MRKVLPFLLVIALAMPALADVAVTVSDAGGGVAEVALAISGGAVVRGAAIKVTVTDAELAAVADVTDVMAGFNTYIDYYYTNTGFLAALPDETALPGSGAHCVANPDEAGVLTALPATVFSISLGALDNTGGQGGVTASGTLCKIQLSNFAGSSASVCVEADALRGGIVGDNLGTVSTDDCADIAGSMPPECVAATAPFYADWVAWGKPDCWCYQKNCRGDADGINSGPFRVANPDLVIFLSAFNKMDAAIPAGGICADFDHKKSGPFRVANPDLTTLLTYFNKMDATVPVCPMDWDGNGVNDYNFWTN